MTTQFIAHQDDPRTFADKKGATKAIKRDLAKHFEAHGDVLYDTGFDVKPSGDRFGVVIYCDLTAKSAKKLVGPELTGYVIEPELKEEPVKKSKPAAQPKPTTTADAPKKASRRKGQVSVAPTLYSLVQCRAGSKQQAIIDMLSRDNVWDQPFLNDEGEQIGTFSLVGGATLDELRTVCIKKDGVTPWDDNSIRSALYYDLKDKGYGTSTQFVDGVPTYSLVLPMGVDAPLAAKAPAA